MADPTLSTSEANHRELAAILGRVSFEDDENCRVEAETPAKKVAMVAAFKSIVVERFCAAHRQGMPNADAINREMLVSWYVSPISLKRVSTFSV